MGTTTAGPGTAGSGEGRPPGWYPEATDATLWRWWDGASWTAHTWDVGVAQRDVDDDRSPGAP